MILPQSRLSRLTLAALATLLGQVGVANADPVVSASSLAAVASGTATPSTTGTPGDPYVNSYSSINDTTGNAYGYSFANIGGAYAVSSNSSGVGNSTAHAQFAHRFENLTGVAQHYTLSFHIYGGSIATSAYYRPLLSGELLTSSYAASVKTSVNNGASWTSVFSTAATVTTDATGSTGSRSGVALTGSDADFSDGSYYWSNDYYSVDLGVVAAGGYVDVLSEVENRALSNVGVYNFTGGDCGGYGYGYGGGYGQNCGDREVFAGTASSFYGDPFELSGDPLAFVLTADAVAQDLPEPASLALVGLGIAAAGAARRRRKD